jgi:hypothetical protein
VAPVEVENLPAAQFMHEDRPGSPEYFPATHKEHEDTLTAPVVVEYLPASHREHALAPSLEYEPAAHVLHTAKPGPEYLPAAQSRQSLSDLAASCGEYLPGAHIAHQSAVAWGNFKNLPATQAVQAEEPSVSAKVPFSHARQFEFDKAPNVGEYLPVGHGKQETVTPEVSM